MIFRIRLANLRWAKEELERKVKEATEEIMEKNEELEAQKSEIEAQRDIVMEQRDQISEQQQELQSSIRYASRIQRAVLPPEKVMDGLMDNYFILNMPRDIVSGDFYWAAEKDKYLFLAAADSTGHGVPGAFMSMLGTTAFYEVLNFRKDKARERLIFSTPVLESLSATHDEMNQELANRKRARIIAPNLLQRRNNVAIPFYLKSLAALVLRML